MTWPDQVNQCRPRINTSALLNVRLLCAAQRYNLMSSKYVVPVPPLGDGAFFVSMPIVIVLTLVSFTPWSENLCRSMIHCVQSAVCVALASS